MWIFRDMGCKYHWGEVQGKWGLFLFCLVTLCFVIRFCCSSFDHCTFKHAYLSQAPELAKTGTFYLFIIKINRQAKHCSSKDR